jgi:hypothetical protein
MDTISGVENIPHCKYFINKKDLRLKVRRHRKGKSDIHPA